MKHCQLKKSLDATIQPYTFQANLIWRGSFKDEIIQFGTTRSNTFLAVLFTYFYRIGNKNIYVSLIHSFKLQS